MRGTSLWLAVVWGFGAACGAGDTRIDPGDLELRDLLGVAPEIAAAWDAPQRAAARRVLAAGLREDDAPLRVDLEPGASSIDDRVARSLAALDARRFADGEHALGMVRVAVAERDLTATAQRSEIAAGALEGASMSAKADLELDGWDAPWGYLAGRGLPLLSALAQGHAQTRVVVAPSPQLPVIAGYVEGAAPRLVVNPVVLAALEPEANETIAISREIAAAGPARAVATPETTAAAGNPYSFYGSYEECASAQRARCEACLASSNCQPQTNITDGNAECTMLGANDGRGYYLECINLSLAITSVDTCTASAAPSCPQNTHAADSLGDLESNVKFLDDATCASALDGCLAKIYGQPQQPFPQLVDGGVVPTPVPPRSTDVSCGDSCGSKNENCTASPSCDCSGPSCNNSLSCDSACSSSNHQSGGCGDSCNSTSSSGSSGGGCGGGGTSSSSSSGCSGCGNNNSSSSSSSCGSCGGSGGSSGCGGGSGGCGGGGSSGKCSVGNAEPSAALALAVSITWGLLPVPFAAVVRRRSKKRSRRRPSCGEAVLP